MSFWSNPAEHLVSRALNKWRAKSLKADNTSCVVVLIDPLGPSKLTLLRRKRQALLSGGEMTGQLTKLPSLPTDMEHRSRHQNKNANCSLSDSHIRVNDDSILKPALVKEHMASSTQRKSFTAGSKSELTESDEECFNDADYSASKPPARWNLRHPTASNRNQSMNTSSIGSSSQHGSKHSQSLRPTKGSSKQSEVLFTKLADSSRAAHDEKGGHEKSAEHSSLGNSIADSIHDDNMEGDSGSDYEKTLPKPPPSTPCTGANVFNESNKEESLHSSADVTDKAFTLASDESIDSPGSSFGSSGRPQTPMSAPAKLSGARRSHISKRAKKKLVKSGKKLSNLPKLNASQNTCTVKSTITDEPASSLTKMNFSQIKSQDNRTSNMGTSVSVATAAVGKDLSMLHIQTSSHTESPARHVLNTSRSMNHIVTPRNQKEAARSISCSGLTPDMSLLMSAMSKSALNNTIATSTTNSDITSQLFSTLMAASIGDSLRSRREPCVVVDDTNVPHASSSVLTQTEPLKQLNKTVSIQKTGSKRWGNFFRASKLGIDQMLHLGSHRKGSAAAGGKFTTSAGKLECSSSQLPFSRNTSLSTSRLADITLSNHLPDVTVSHLADFTLNASSITAGDLTNLSALSAGDDVLLADDLAAAHHSMIDADFTDKTSKKRKGFLQKTRVTLRRARKAAKKAFFPENHRLFNKPSGNKRRSDEFLPTPEQKRRRQLDADKSTIS